MKKKRIACVYKIINIKNKKFYLGGTVNFVSRTKTHLRDLRKNRHRNIYLQNAYNKYGEESFVFKIFKMCNKRNVLKTEQFYLDRLNWSKSYNISKSACGGFLLTNHPDREKIIANATRILIEQNQSEAAQLRRKAQVGDKNPNYGNRWSKALKKKVSKIVKKRWASKSESEKEEYRKICKKVSRKNWDSENGQKIRKNKSIRMKGKGNHFFGKTHSKKVRAIISKKNKGQTNPSHYKPTSIEGIVYKSMTDASFQLKVSVPTVHYRCGSSNPKFKNWIVVGEKKETKKLIYSKSKRYQYKEQIFDSIIEACRYFNKSSAAMIFRARSKDPKWKDYSILD